MAVKVKNLNAERINADGTRTVLQYSTISTEQAQHIVGGYVQMQPTTDGRIMLMDEEGLLKSKPYNSVASTLIYGNHHVVGDVLVCPKKMFR